MRRLMLALLVAAAAPAAAQVPVTETLLHLGETGEVLRAPDELRVSLRVEARAPTAAAAQEAVNRRMAAAIERARAVPGVALSTGGYWAGRVDDNRAWSAGQSLTLRGGDAAALLDLAGALQAQGLAVQGLAWGLTREAERAAREEAGRLALEALRRRAEAVAGQLGLAVAGLSEVRMEAPEARPMPRAMAMAARAEPAPPPVAIAEDLPVSVSVQGVAVLRPR